MTTTELYDKIVAEKPAALYLGGKTATGKSTFARHLQDELDYSHVELEAVLMNLVAQCDWDEQSAFFKVFRQTGPSNERDQYLQTVEQTTAKCQRQYKRIVVEGAIANSQTLQRVLANVPDLMFVYFHPSDLSPYVRNLTERFTTAVETPLAGLPKSFWDLIDPKEFEAFRRTGEISDFIMRAIRAFAQVSQHESQQRLEQYHQLFDDIIVVGIV